MSAAAELIRQHPIDPQICIRCNTCEETCPTGAIDSWRRVARAYSIAEQFQWDALPAESEAAGIDATEADIPDEVARLLADENTFVYLCGHKQMEAGVDAAFAEVCGAEWKAMKDQLRSTGRYHVETY